MLSKQAIIVALVGLNLLLLAGVVLVGYTPPAALAQEAAGPAEEPADTIVAVQYEGMSDVIFVVDGQNQLLHAFLLPFAHEIGERIQVTHLGTRDLGREFRKEARR